MCKQTVYIVKSLSRCSTWPVQYFFLIF